MKDGMAAGALGPTVGPYCAAPAPEAEMGVAEAPVAEAAGVCEMPASLAADSGVTVRGTADLSPAEVTFAATTPTVPSLAGYAPRAGSYNTSDNSWLVDIDSLSVSNVSATQDRIRFTATAEGDALGSDFDRSVSIDVRRAPGTDRVQVTVDGQTFNGRITFGRDGSMSIRNTDSSVPTGMPRSIAVGPGGSSFSAVLDAPTGNIRVSATHQ